MVAGKIEDSVDFGAADSAVAVMWLLKAVVLECEEPDRGRRTGWQKG